MTFTGVKSQVEGQRQEGDQWDMKPGMKREEYSMTILCPHVRQKQLIKMLSVLLTWEDSSDFSLNSFCLTKHVTAHLSSRLKCTSSSFLTKSPCLQQTVSQKRNKSYHIITVSVGGSDVSLFTARFHGKCLDLDSVLLP